MSSSAVAPDATLLARLGKRAEADGFVPFDRFVDVVLYDPDAGYYARPRTLLGPHGDFYTAVHVHPMFAQCVAARAVAAAREVPPGRPLRWVELGPGDGRLSEQVVPELRAALGSALVEAVLADRSPTLRTAAVDRLRQAPGVGALPVRAVGSIAELGPFEGIVFANELFDAQPVRRFRRSKGGWQELGARRESDRLVPAERPVNDPETLPRLPSAAADGTVFELPQRAQALVREVADHLVRGTFLALDFGAEESELLAGAPSGTLATARRHRPGTDPFLAPGEEDLSTWVNFDRLRNAASSAGLREIAFRPQSEALVAWGLERVFRSALASASGAEAEVKTRLALKSLLYNFGTFRAIEWAAGSSGAVTS